jgi:hypothetical protein
MKTVWRFSICLSFLWVNVVIVRFPWQRVKHFRDTHPHIIGPLSIQFIVLATLASLSTEVLLLSFTTDTMMPKADIRSILSHIHLTTLYRLPQSAGEHLSSITGYHVNSRFPKILKECHSKIKPTNALYFLCMSNNPTHVSAAIEPSSGVQSHVHFSIH